MTGDPESADDLDATHELVELTRFTDSASASLAQAQLESHGIPAKLVGEALAGWFSSWWGNTICGVRLHVKREDALRAQEVLSSIEALDESSNFDYGDRSPEIDDEVSSQADADADLQRAWYASIIGLVLCPPLLNLYSMWILLSNGCFRGSRSDVMRRVRLTLIVNLTALLFALSFGSFFVSMVILSPDPPAGSLRNIEEFRRIFPNDDESSEPTPPEPLRSKRTFRY